MTNHQPPTISHPLKTALEQLIAAALAEDIGAGDITSELLIAQAMQAEMTFVAREQMVVCGSEVPQLVYQHPALLASQGYGKITTRRLLREGGMAAPGDVIASIAGPARLLLAGERVTLNLVQRMSGVATLTAKYVEAVRGTKAVILDTRKTIPGLRMLDKYAVKTGGGQNHRMGLYDMVLIKDNHIALCGGVAEAVIKARRGLTGKPALPIVVECDTLAQVREALAAKPDRILLDNMSLKELRAAVALAAGALPLEASGGVSLETIRAIAETGVDFISVGKLTHSAPAADIGADIVISN